MCISGSLDQVAWTYLMTYPPEKEQHAQALIQHGATAVFPLLRGAVRATVEFNPRTISQDRARGVVDWEAAETVWINNIGLDLIQSVYDIVTRIGQPAQDALCRALWESDERMRIWASLILLQDKHPNSRTTRAVRDVSDHLGRNEGSSESLIESGLMVMLTVLIARGGDTRVQSIVADFIRQNAANERDFDAITENTGLKYLLRLKS